MQGLTETATAVAGYAFPNDYHVHWSLMIVLYPYITGIVAGAFFISSLYYVFHLEVFKPVAKFSLLFTLAFLACAPLPLLNHLGHPERNFNMLLTPSPSSAMAGFGYIYSIYGVMLLLQILLIYRKTLVNCWMQASGFMKKIYFILAMGSDNIGEKSLSLDQKIINVLAAVGIPTVCVLSGYVGFIFGGVKANPLWTTPLMPVIFLLSGGVSGFSGIIIGYMLIKRGDVDMSCLRSCIKGLWIMFILAFSFEMLEIGMHSYQATHHWEALHELYWGPLYKSYWIYQVFFLSIIPLIMLTGLNLIRFSPVFFKVISFIASTMILCQVLFMRWNVVIGGQLMSKSEKGSVFFHPEWIEKEGILPAIIIMILPVVILFVLSRVFPFWQTEKSSS